MIVNGDEWVTLIDNGTIASVSFGFQTLNIPIARKKLPVSEVKSDVPEASENGDVSEPKSGLQTKKKLKPKLEKVSSVAQAR